MNKTERLDNRKLLGTPEGEHEEGSARAQKNYGPGTSETSRIAKSLHEDAEVYAAQPPVAGGLVAVATVDTMQPPAPSEAQLEAWRASLYEREAAPATIEKYLRCARRLAEWLKARRLPLSRGSLVAYKQHLIDSYAPATVNSALAAINGLVGFLGHPELRLHRLRVQRESARSESRELTKAEYKQLVRAAIKLGDEQLALLAQAICAMGIRVSELAELTVEAVEAGRVTICNKGRVRKVWLPEKLRRKLRVFACRAGRTHGPVFVSRSGKPMDRTSVWRKLKYLARVAGVAASKVFPHNLRHLFAVEFYRTWSDMDGLACVLGHARVETTRIYLAVGDSKRKRQMQGLGLVI